MHLIGCMLTVARSAEQRLPHVQIEVATSPNSYVAQARDRDAFFALLVLFCLQAGNCGGNKDV